MGEDVLQVPVSDVQSALVGANRETNRSVSPIIDSSYRSRTRIRAPRLVFGSTGIGGWLDKPI
jgi:hypothetical protein